MTRVKVGSGPPPVGGVFFLDAAALLEGANVEPGRCVTTQEVLGEVGSKGASGRRVEQLVAAGLVERAPRAASVARVKAVAAEAGNAGRLSEADVSILALALDGAGVLLSDDYTVLDLAKRLGIEAAPVSKAGIVATKDWRARCSGCGRVFGPESVAKPCPVCGSEVRLKPAPRRRS